ncbi:MAG: hypothetical protein AB7H70_00730 [Rhodospirillaceae bacterium]
MANETPDEKERRREQPDANPKPAKPEIDPKRTLPDEVRPPREPRPDTQPERQPYPEIQPTQPPPAPQPGQPQQPVA